MNPSSAPLNLIPNLVVRLTSLEQETGDAQIGALRRTLADWEQVLADGALADGAGSLPTWDDAPLDVERLRDLLSTRLMEVFRLTGSAAAFGLLYELNHRIFLAAISSRLRKFYFALDPQDVLQEVFFNIYRYPHRFQADRERAFRYWAGMIVRNTVYKSTRDKDRELTHEQQDEEIDTRADELPMSNPLGRVILEESQRFCGSTYRLYLSMYLAAYEQLSQRERRALHKVEVEGMPYKSVALEMRIRLENLKMVIFRARKKILRALDRAMSTADSWRPDMVAGRRSDSFAVLLRRDFEARGQQSRGQGARGGPRALRNVARGAARNFGSALPGKGPNSGSAPSEPWPLG